MAIYDNFPYTNIHEMNLRWVIEQVKQGNLTIEDFAEQLQQFAEDYDTLSALATAFTIAGSNISTTKNFSAASLAGPLTGNVTGNLTGNVTGDVTGNVTGNVTGDVTGNVTGNVTGDVTGNADTATYATSAGSATNATNANNATYATSAGAANTANTASTATVATQTSNFFMRTDITSDDADDYMPTLDGLAVFKTGELTSHIMSSLANEYFIIIAIKEGSHGWQIAYCPYGSSDIFFRTKFASWTNWMKVTATTAT